MDEREALMSFRLAPLRSRRDIAALGIIHRAVLGKGPPQLIHFFRVDNVPPGLRSARRHNRQVIDDYERLHRDYINRSVFGYVWVYNLLPMELVQATSVKIFQQKCHLVLKEMAS